MLFPMNCGIIVPEDIDEDETEYIDEDDSENEIATVYKSLKSQQNIKQITSMALTLSLYQNTYQRKMLSKAGNDSFRFVGLIPLIAATPTHFDIYLYDSEHDILLRNMGPPLPLWEDELLAEPALDLSSVLKLWMTLNYMDVAPSISEHDVSLLSGSCGFVSNMDANLLENIRGTLKMTDRFYPKAPMEFNFSFLRSPKAETTINVEFLSNTVENSRNENNDTLCNCK